MRNLGSELGVEAMSLYHYFPNKVALLDGMVETLAAEVEVPPVGSVPWDEAVRTIVRSFRELGRRHPNSSRLLLECELPPAGEAAEEAMEHHLAVGFDEATARLAFRAFSAYAWGSLIEDQRLEPPFTPRDRDAEFELGLDALIAGVEALTGNPKRSSGT